MKKITYLLIIGTFLFASCGTNSSKTDNESSTNGTETKQADKGPAQNCTEFLDEYEEWTNKSIEFLEAFIKNPMDMELSSKYMNFATEGLDWYSRWSKFYDCAAEEKYNKRFAEIAEKTEKKMKELGLD